MGMGANRPDGLASVKASFQVGRHVIQVSRTAERWSVSVDDKPLTTWHMTQVEAWEAGVREADRLDRGGSA
jgi:hypothetical protein